MASRAPRGPNFSVMEDVTMCKIHLSISQDSSVGTDQSKAQLWSRIKNEMEQQLPDIPKRPWTSIQKRYQEISKDVALFVAKESEVEGEHHTGWGPEQKIEEIRKRFKECNDNKKFKHEECYPIMLENIKYNRRSTFVFDTTHDMEEYENNGVDAEGHQRTTQGESGNDTDIGDIENTYFRQMGKKEAKRLKKTGREKSTAQEEMMGIIIKQQDDFNSHYKEQSKLKIAQRQAEFEAKQAMQHRLEAKQAKDEELRIMGMKLDGMDPVEKEYYQLLKADIVRNMRTRAQALVD